MIAVALLLLQDGGEIPTGRPVSSMGRIVPMAKGTAGAIVAFIQPRSLFAIAAYGGIEIPVQARVERHADNRAFRLAWDGDGCGGASWRQLEGEDASALQPNDTPVLVLASAGRCVFVAEVYAANRKLRGRAQIEVDVR